METIKLSELIFYIFSIGLPAIFCLYALGFLVYVIGEYTENREIIPNGLLLVTAKLFIICFMLFMELYILFEITEPTINLIAIVMFMFGNLICMESISIIRTLRMVDKILNCKKTNCLKLQTHKLFLKSKALILLKAIFAIILLLISTINIFVTDTTNLMVINLLLIIYLLFNYYIVKYVVKNV